MRWQWSDHTGSTRLKAHCDRGRLRKETGHQTTYRSSLSRACSNRSPTDISVLPCSYLLGKATTRCYPVFLLSCSLALCHHFAIECWFNRSYLLLSILLHNRWLRCSSFHMFLECFGCYQDLEFSLCCMLRTDLCLLFIDLLFALACILSLALIECLQIFFNLF